MNRILLAVVVFGVAAIVAGLAITYLGTQRAEVNTTQASFSFGSSFLHDDSSNKTYLRGGNYTIYNCKSDTLEIIATHPPALFNQSKLPNVYFAVWEGGITPDVPGNVPDKMIRADLIYAQAPEAFLFDLGANTVSVELLSNETFSDLGSSSTWTADFLRIHTLPGNPEFMTLGIILPDVGIVIVLLTTYSLDRLSSKTGNRKWRGRGHAESTSLFSLYLQRCSGSVVWRLVCERASCYRLGLLQESCGLIINLRGKLFFLSPLKPQHSFLGKLWPFYTFRIGRFHNRSETYVVPYFFYQLLFFEMAFSPHIPLPYTFPEDV